MRGSQFFLFQILIDDENDKNLAHFLKTLATLICSAEYCAHPSALTDEEASEYLYTNDVPNIDEFLEENYSKYFAFVEQEKQQQLLQEEENKKQIRNNNKLIDLNLNNGKNKIKKNVNNNINHSSDDEEVLDINKIEQLTEKFAKQVEIKSFCFKKAYPHAKKIFSAFGALLIYDPKIDDLELLSEIAELQIYKVAEYEYKLVVDEKGNQKTYTSTLIAPEMSLRLKKSDMCLLWLAKDSNVSNAYNFVFKDSAKIEELRTLLTKSQYEGSNRNDYEDLKEEDRQWLENANNTELDMSSSALDIEMDLENDYEEENTGGTNVSSAQAFLHDRTFIVRDDNVIAVYKSEQNDHLLKVIFYFCIFNNFLSCGKIFHFQ